MFSISLLRKALALSITAEPRLHLVGFPFLPHLPAMAIGEWNPMPHCACCHRQVAVCLLSTVPHPPSHFSHNFALPRFSYPYLPHFSHPHLHMQFHTQSHTHSNILSRSCTTSETFQVNKPPPFPSMLT